MGVEVEMSQDFSYMVDVCFFGCGVNQDVFYVHNDELAHHVSEILEH